MNKPIDIEIKSRLLALDTAALSDAMDSLGVNRALHGIVPRVEGCKIAGPVFTVQYEAFNEAPNGFQNAGNYIDEVPPGHIVVINNHGNTECTNWGDILTRKAMSQEIEGTIINGSARDISFIRKNNYPLFSKGVFMVSGKNRVRVTGTNVEVNISGVTVSPGDWICADDNGVLVLPYEHLLEIINRAENVNATEANIIEAIEQGTSLNNARTRFNYANPWRANDGN